ncbi:MAG TPA: hypothetical protein VD788_02040, partial [Candidatus Polarisedimenticolaceae bacterium]|nr:hypothetical protein [Candidatus Polarisedimenticolaceae bacterium]
MPARARLAVFAAPFFAETTVRFVRAAAGLPGVRLAVLSQDPLDRMPSDLRRAIAAHQRIPDALDATAIADAVAELASVAGRPVDRLVGALEQLQVPLAQVRERLGIDGMGVEAALNFRDKSRMKDVLRAAGVPCA